MRHPGRFALALAIAGCGASTPSPAPAPAPAPPPPPTTAVADPAPVAERAPEPSPEPPPPPAPPARPARVSIFERLRDDAGDVAGVPGWSIKRKSDATYCGGIKIVTDRGKAKLAAEDKLLGPVYALTFPTGLDFSPDPAKKKQKEASLKKFNDWVETLMKVGREAQAHYASVLGSADADADAKLRAVARIAQIQLRLASVVARAEMPKDVRTGEFADDKKAAFCDKLEEVAEPMLGAADAAIEICVGKLATGSAGWWTKVCVAK